MNASGATGNGISPRPSSSCVLSEAEGGCLQLLAGDCCLVVDPGHGARVVSFRVGEYEALTSSSVVAAGDANLQNMFGSTFWTSPQSDWQWPPEEAVDRGRYEVERKASAFVCSGQAGSKTGYSILKEFSFNATRGCFEVAYELRGTAGSGPVAPWEVSRVPKGGIVVFPAATQACEPSSIQTQVVDGVAWLELDAVPSGDQKVFQDASEGWLAYVQDGVAFIKTFPNIPRKNQAPGEAEVEVFVSGDYAYVELEQQGAFERFDASFARRWTVGWWLRIVPKNLPVSAGSGALVRWIRRVISGDEQ